MQHNYHHAQSGIKFVRVYSVQWLVVCTVSPTYQRSTELAAKLKNHFKTTYSLDMDGNQDTLNTAVKQTFQSWNPAVK